MHYLESVRLDIERTHENLGDLVVISLLAVKAKMCLLVVSPAGAGKSTSSNFIAREHPQTMVLDSTTRNGLFKIKSQLEGYQGVVIIDDVGKIDNVFSRDQTIVSLAELCYSHFVRKLTGMMDEEIKGYDGAAIINIQPIVLRRLIEIDQWESNLRDKTLRAFHLYRPLLPAADIPAVSVLWGLSLSQVEAPVVDAGLVRRLLGGPHLPWSRGRVSQHLSALLRAAAAYDNRSSVNGDDEEVLVRALRSSRLEPHLIRKGSFESKRELTSDLLCLLTEFATHGAFTLDHLCVDFGMTVVDAASIMARYAKWVKVQKNSPLTFYPGREMLKLLDIYGAKVSKRTRHYGSM